MPTTDQVLTASFKLRGSNTKFAALRRASVHYDRLFFRFMEEYREKANQLVAFATKDGLSSAKTVKGKKNGKQVATDDDLAVVASIKKEKTAWLNEVKRHVEIAAAKDGLASTLASGMSYDVHGALSSYIELMIAYRLKEQACKNKLFETVNQAEDFLGFPPSFPEKDPKGTFRPLTIVRARECKILRSEGRLVAVLYLIRASDVNAQMKVVTASIDAVALKETAEIKSKCVMVFPLECSKWHENKFLSGNATLSACKIIEKNGEWFLNGQFTFAREMVELSGAMIGVDRGVVNPAAVVAVDADGRVLEVGGIMGNEISQIMNVVGKKRASQQRRKKKKLLTQAVAVDNVLHVITNRIVALALKHRATVSIEDLAGLKEMITTKRVKGTRKGGWRKTLKRAQMGKLESLLSYKLTQVGLPQPRKVTASFTSITCPECGHSHKDNRQMQEKFHCVECGHEANADTNAATIIARRGVLLREVKKGDKFDFIASHRDMAARLKKADSDSGRGLGTTSGFEVVVARAAVSDAYLIGRDQSETDSSDPAKPGFSQVFASRREYGVHFFERKTAQTPGVSMG